MDAGIYFPLFLVLVNAGATSRRRYSIHYLPADLQSPEMFNLAARFQRTHDERAGKGSFMISNLCVATSFGSVKVKPTTAPGC